jgi:plasminogen activator inhibitor 1 RNA-binding protein
MENEYGVNTTNKFAFLMDDDHDPDETIAEAGVRAAVDKKAALEAEAAAVIAAKKTVKVDFKKTDERKDGKENRGPPLDNQRGRGGGRGRGAPRGGGQRRPFNDAPMPAHEAAPLLDAEGNPLPARQPYRRDPFPRDQHFPRAPHGDGEARGGMAPGVGGRGRRGRTDRQSGNDRTGVKEHEKRAGGGKGNWGTTADQLAGETDPLNVSVEANGEEKKVEEKAVVVEQYVEPPQPEDNTMTLAQYKASKMQSEAPVEFNVRKVHMQKTMKPLHTKLDDSLDEEIIIVEKRAPKKQVLNIDINFAKGASRGEESGGRGGRGGRGGSAPFGQRNDRPPRGDFAPRGEFAPRGGRGDFGGRGGRGGNMGGRPAPSSGYGGRGAQPNVDDLNSFPALG